MSVVVPTHARSVRLRWLLNALEAQDLGEPWEVVVVHDYDPATAERVIERHPLARAGRLTHEAIEPGTGSPARQRNIGWRIARGRLIAFIDDDCRPATSWLRALLDAEAAAPGRVVQGRTRPDPLEIANAGAPHVRTLDIEPVNPHLEACNILYSREILEQLGGLDEAAITGEDTDLGLRACEQGATIVPAAEAVVYHAVEAFSLPEIIRQNLKWAHLPYLVRRHPEFRNELALGIFWDGHHMRATLALAGLVAGAWRRPLLALVLPFVIEASGRRGPGALRRAVATLELPGQLVRQGAEIAGMLVGSVRHRTILL